MTLHARDARSEPSRSPFTFREIAWQKLQPALEHLAATLVAHGEPARAPFQRLGAPPLTRLIALDRAAAAEQAIALVRAVFHLGLPSSALTNAAKRVGNAALGIKRSLAYEEARQARIALREARPVKGGARRAA